MEATRPPPSSQTSTEKPAAAQQAIPAGFVACACCGGATLPEDLYAAEDGDICHQCNAQREAADVSKRGDRDRAMTVLFMPGFTAVALVVLQYMLILFTRDPAFWLAPIPAVMSLAGVHAVVEAARSQSDPGDRVMLAAAGVLNLLVHALLALAMFGVVG